MCDDRLAKIDGPVDDGLFLLPLQDSWDDGLSGDAEPAVVDDHGPQGVQTLKVHSVVHFHALKYKNKASLIFKLKLLWTS